MLNNLKLDIESYNAVVQSLIAIIAVIGGGLIMLSRDELQSTISPLMGVIFGFYFRDPVQLVNRANGAVRAMFQYDEHEKKEEVK